MEEYKKWKRGQEKIAMSQDEKKKTEKEFGTYGRFYRYKDGTLGGWVEHTAYVSLFAIVGDDSMVLEYGRVEDHAVVRNFAVVKGNARIMGCARIQGCATVQGNARVSGGSLIGEEATVQENARVSGYAYVLGKSVVEGNATVSENVILNNVVRVDGNAKVYGYAILHWCTVQDHARVYGRSTIRRGTVGQYARVYGDALIDRSCTVRGTAHIFGNALVSGSAVVEGNAYIHGDAEVLENALIYGNSVVCDNAVVAGNSRVCGHAMVCWNARITGSSLVHGETVVVGTVMEDEDNVEEDRDNRERMRDVLSLHGFLENTRMDVTINDVSEESLRHVLEKQGMPTENKSKQEMWEDLVAKKEERLETLRRPQCPEEKKDAKEDAFGNTIENPVMGDDGIVYDKKSMETWFEKKDNGDYRWIPYTYVDGVSVPVYKPVGGEKALTRYFND